MAKIDVNTVAKTSAAGSFDEFVSNFQTNISNLSTQSKYQDIMTDKEYELDEDGFIVGDSWSEIIAAEIMQLNGFVPTIERINTLLEGRALYENSSVPSDYKLVAIALAMEPPKFLKMFPKFPIVYFTRWGNLRKPRDLKELLANPIKTKR